MKNFIFAFLSFYLITTIAIASPSPATGSSELSQSLKNTLHSDEFRVGTFNHDFWSLSPQINSSASKLSSWHFQGLGNNQSARFSVHIDKLNEPIDLKQYVKKWIKEYPYLGFEILATNTMKIDGKPTFVVDLANKTKNKQLRQFVVHNKEKNMAVVMTCTDSREKFLATIDKCHEIIKNFQWAASAPTKNLSR